MILLTKLLIIIAPLTLSGCSNITPQEQSEIEEMAADLVLKIAEDAIDK